MVEDDMWDHMIIHIYVHEECQSKDGGRSESCVKWESERERRKKYRLGKSRLSPSHFLFSLWKMAIWNGGERGEGMGKD